MDIWIPGIPSQMETEVILKFSSTDFTTFSNLSDTTTKSTSVEETFKWTNAEIARLIQIIIRPILILVGTLGNCLSFYVMRRTSLKNVSSCFTCRFWLWPIQVSICNSSKLICHKDTIWRFQWSKHWIASSKEFYIFKVCIVDLLSNSN